MTTRTDLRDPHLAALVERVPDDLFARDPKRPRRGLVRWLRALRRP